MLASHDDYSIVDLLPPGAAVITQLRDPVDRVISAYEFAVTQAALSVHLGREAFYNATSGWDAVNTANVWPWSILVPWFYNDMRSRVSRMQLGGRITNHTQLGPWREYFDPRYNRTYQHNAVTGSTVWDLPEATASLDPYKNKLVMPLKQWIEQPIAQELVHEGSTLQILGITNYSKWQNEAKVLRRCFFSDAPTRAALQEMARQRLEGLAHVGMTDALDDSVLTLSDTFKMDLNGTAYKELRRIDLFYDQADSPQLEKKVSYNATRDKTNGKIVHLSVFEARQTIVRLKFELNKLNNEIYEKRLAAEQGEKEQMEKPNWRETGSPFYAAARNVTRYLSRRMEGQLERLVWLRSILEAGRKKIAFLSGASSSLQTAAPKSNNSSNSAILQEVATLEDYAKRMVHDLEALMAISEVKGLDSNNIEDLKGARALLPLPDEEYKQNGTLWESYKECSWVNTSSSGNETIRAFQMLRTPKDESFAFTRAARKAIDPTVKARILELNSIDAELFRLGKALLTSHMDGMKRGKNEDTDQQDEQGASIRLNSGGAHEKEAGQREIAEAGRQHLEL